MKGLNYQKQGEDRLPDLHSITKDSLLAPFKTLNLFTAFLFGFNKLIYRFQWMGNTVPPFKRQNPTHSCDSSVTVLQNHATCTKFLAPSTEQKIFIILFPSASVETLACILLESSCKTRLCKRHDHYTNHIC